MNYKKTMGNDFKKVTPRVTEKAATDISKWFYSLNAGVEYIINSFSELHKKTLLEVLGIFDHDELVMIVTLAAEFNMTHLSAGEQLFGVINDNVDMPKKIRDNLIDKCSSLTCYQIFSFEVWAYSIYRNDTIPTDKEIEYHITHFI